MEQTVIGVDLGGTKVHVARISRGEIELTFRMNISAKEAEQVVVDEVKTAIAKVFNDQVAAIGIGVPGLVDQQSGYVFDMVNIPSWKEVPLGGILSDYFGVPVVLNNDANCFALGEYYWGSERTGNTLVGLTLGTGMGAGLVVDGRLYCGANCGAGEFGMLPYKDHNFEYYCSGHFFREEHGTTGEAVYSQAQQGDQHALHIWQQLGQHLGYALTAIYYTLDPHVVVLGGSVSKGFPFFKKAMENVLKSTLYPRVLRDLRVRPSTLENAAVLGSAALTFELLEQRVGDEVS